MISWLCTMFLFFAGMFTEYLQQLAENQVPGGGPAEAFYRVASGRVDRRRLWTNRRPPRCCAAPMKSSPGCCAAS